MSGPKYYAPPPSYSMQVFDGKLNQVFQLQSRLMLLFSEIDCLILGDNKLDIHFDCKQDVNKLRKQFEGFLKALVFDYQGTFSQNTYNIINQEIEFNISGLTDALNQCQTIKSGFEGKKADYESYLSYLSFFENSKIFFNDYKGQIVQYFKTHIENNAPEIFSEVDKQIHAVAFEKDKTVFSFGFNSKIDSEKQKIIDHILKKEDEVNIIRAGISDKVIDKFRSKKSDVKMNFDQDAEVSDELKVIIVKIKSLIRNCADLAMKRKYNAHLEKLQSSETLMDIYFFKELHDTIYESEKTRKLKIEFQNLIVEINKQEIHPSLNIEQQNILKICINQLNSSGISMRQFEDTLAKYKRLNDKSIKCFVEDEIKKKEHLFLKSQIILSLENQGYEVMDDLEVIDFEKEDDFLLKIHEQNNYLNLKFRDDGSLKYVFQIPENKVDLSTDQKNLKLHEMEVTCSEFKEVLKTLAEMGLKMNMKSERPVELNSIVTMTNKQKETLKNTTIKQIPAQQMRKKYLNR